MRLLNVGCGANRPQDLDWINIDNLHAIFPDASCPEREQMDAEPNYFDHDLRLGLKPFEDNSVHGILASHFMEHLDCCEALTFLKECRRVLIPGGIMRISVPDPKLMRELEKLDIDYWHQFKPKDMTFIEYALFFAAHKQLLTDEALYTLLDTAGFTSYYKVDANTSTLPKLATIDNRQSFSLFVEGVK
jgi:predicted SAM-dependent methyltransferase